MKTLYVTIRLELPGSAMNVELKPMRLEDMEKGCEGHPLVELNLCHCELITAVPQACIKTALSISSHRWRKGHTGASPIL